MDSEAQLLECLDLKRRADRLGITFTSAMTLAELTAAVTARESDMDKPSFAFVNGQWEINGALPNGLTFVDGKFKAPPNQDQPECFGDLWDGAVGGAAECASCVFSPVCREVMAKITFTAARAALGGEATLPALAEHCDVSEQSVLALMAVMKGEMPKKKKRPPVAEAAPEAPAPEAKAPEAPAPEAPPTAPAPEPAPAPVTEKPAAQPVAAAPEPTPATPEPVVKEKRKAAKKAKPAKDKEPAVTAGPQKARPAKRAKAGARARKAKSAKPAKARVGAPEGKWGEHTWLKRWERERKRCPAIRRAMPGAVLQVERLGQTYRAKVFKGHYELSNGQKCATLCEAAKLLTGSVNWSAVKFWNLENMEKIPPKAHAG